MMNGSEMTLARWLARKAIKNLMASPGSQGALNRTQRAYQGRLPAAHAGKFAFCRGELWHIGHTQTNYRCLPPVWPDQALVLLAFHDQS